MIKALKTFCLEDKTFLKRQTIQLRLSTNTLTRALTLLTLCFQSSYLNWVSVLYFKVKFVHMVVLVNHLEFAELLELGDVAIG